ncbi:MAG: nicotinate (nicotinamide) nucleotide adenylyltransferase [Saprospiraceae bacterium]|nr:nicotinate (nicotinamide) nucleotide adenylyltransferase [Saprospiraceae bacterium]
MFGSFNPIHVGHLIIGQYMATRTDCTEVHFIVSPHNPLKRPAGLADARHRLQMVRLAVRRNPLLIADPVEFGLSRPSYTIDTLEYLAQRHPRHQYRLIIGSDNLAIFTKWKRWEDVLDQFGCYVYLRSGHDPGKLGQHPAVTICDAPFLDISATYIRACLREKRSIRYLVPDNVLRYLHQHAVFDFLR